MKTIKELEDAVRQYQNGNMDSFNRIYELSYGYLYTCVIHVVKDKEAAADMLQETYLEISRNLSQLKNTGDFLSWASTIGNRKCYAYLKKHRDVLVRSDDDQNGDAQDFFESIADDEAFIPETILQDREKQRLVQEIIDGLSDMQRLCIIGFYYRGQSIEEIAQELELPANTVKSHLSRAKAKIKDAVIVLDREKGTRLYCIAPFMLLFLSKEAEACEAGPMPKVLENELGGSGVTNPGAGNSIAQRILQAGLRYKLAAGIVLAAAVIGGGAALIYSANTSRNAGEENPSEAVSADESGEQTDENLQADTAGESEPEGQETAPDAETGEQEESMLIEIDLTEYEYFGNVVAGGVIPVRQNGLWGAVNYENEEIAPCAYPSFSQDPNLAGYFVTESVSEDGTVNYTLFAPDGTKIYEGTDYVQALGDFYVVCSMISSDEGYNNTVQRRDYYDYDGNHVLSTDYLLPDLWNTIVMGSCDGETPVFRQSFRRNEEIDADAEEFRRLPWVYTETGVLYADGTVRWNSEPKWENYSGWSPIFDDGSTMICMYPRWTPNHGYSLEYLYGSGYAMRWHEVFTEDQHAFNLYLYKWPEDDALDWDWEWNWEYFWYDGAVFGHYGSKAVWEIEANETYLLVDLALAEVTDTDVYHPSFDGPVVYADWETILQVAEDHIPRGMVLAAYDYIGMDMNRYWYVEKGDQVGYIDHEGNEIAMYDDASSFFNGYALIVEDGTAFLINEDFEIVEECGDADSVVCCEELFYIVKDGTVKTYLLNAR